MKATAKTKGKVLQSLTKTQTFWITLLAAFVDEILEARLITPAQKNEIIEYARKSYSEKK